MCIRDRPEAGYPESDTPDEMVIAGRSGVSTLRAPLPDSPQEVRDVAGQEDQEAEALYSEAPANVGASVGQTTPHTSSFMSSLGLGHAIGVPAPDYSTWSLLPPATQTRDMSGVEVSQATLGTTHHHQIPAASVKHLSDPSIVTIPNTTVEQMNLERTCTKISCTTYLIFVSYVCILTLFTIYAVYL